MSRYDWSDEDALGDPVFDAEHRELITLVGTLAAASAKAAGPVLATLEALTIRHFEHEESRMAETGYYGRAAHRAEHSVVLEGIAALRKRGTSLDPAAAAQELADTLVRHIREVDRSFAAFLARTRD